MAPSKESGDHLQNIRLSVGVGPIWLGARSSSVTFCCRVTVCPDSVNSFVVERENSVAQAPCVCLVDDDRAVCRAIKLLLQTSHYDVRDYSQASDLLCDAQALTCGCLITDYYMPGMSGFELLRKLRKSGWLHPAILITGHNEHDLVQRAIACGFYAVVEKPLVDLRVIKLLKECLGAPIVG
jgi:CheY-like chemotaxis protein